MRSRRLVSSMSSPPRTRRAAPLDGEPVGPERGVMIGDGHPALGGRLEDELRDALLAVVDGDGAVERDPHPHGLPGQDPGHTAAIAADLDVGVPANLARLPVRGVIAPRPAFCPSKLLDLVGSAAYLSVSPWTIRELEAGGILRRVRVPLPSGGELRKLLFDKIDLDTL